MVTVSNKTQPYGERTPQPVLDNPITQYFDVGLLSCTAGPGLIWRIHDATRRSDGKVCSVFVFEKRIADKLFKPKRRENCVERMRKCIDQLDLFRHPRMLQIFHPVEEGPETLCFASEHVYGSLHNILTWHESIPREPKDAPIMPYPLVLHPLPQMRTTPLPPSQPAPYSKEYHFLDFELCYGFLQLIEALEFMHYELRLIHRNVCPQVIIICTRGTWKLFGLEFVETVVGEDPTEMVTVSPWSVKIASIAQPNLDYLAPEVQMRGQCNVLSDMFSLGLVICTTYNHGVSLLQANNNPILYMKQIESLSENVNALLRRMPPSLQEAVQRLCMREPSPRPTTQLLPLIKYFKSKPETAIRALQYLDVISMKDDVKKTNFYNLQLMDALPLIPPKLRWQMVWPVLMREMYNVEILQAAIDPIIWIAGKANHDDFSKHVTAPIKYLLNNNGKNVHATVAILESLGTILKKCPKFDLHNEILPIYYDCFDSKLNEIQTSTLVSLLSVAEYIDDHSLHAVVLMKVRTLLEKNTKNVKIICLVIGFFEQVICRLDRSALEHVVPTLLAMRLHDPGVMSRIIKLYRIMLNDCRFGLSTNVMATQVIPALAPQTVNPNLNIEEFTSLMEILYDMLGNIDQNQRLKMKVDAKNASGSMRSGPRLLSFQKSNDVIAPPFNIPNLRVEQRKTSSAEDVIRKNSVTGPAPTGTGSIGDSFRSTGIGQWFFGSNNSNNDNNFLRVISIYPNRRLSDNTMIHKNRLGPSCSSSPGNAPRGSVGGGGGSAGTSAGLLPARRHSSIGPQERRGSTINMSPPVAGQQQRYRIGGGSGSILTVPVNQPGPATGPGADPHRHAASVPFLLTSSSHSLRSRRPSAAAAASTGAGAGSSLLQQISSGMVRHLPRPPPSPSMTHSAAWSLQQTAAMAVRKCPSLNVTVAR